MSLLGFREADDIFYSRWSAVFYGNFSTTMSEREKYWDYNDDVEFSIACDLKRLIDARS